MALIPPDVGLRMRLQNESSLLQPLQPVHEIPSDLPELRPGQTFNARIQEVLPDNSYKALVAGKLLTLQLPEGAKPGDQMDLVVIDRSARVLIARQIEASTPQGVEGEATPYPFAKFSPAARMISQLLPAEGEAPAAAQLNRGQPLLAQAPATPSAATQLASTLARAVTQSGVFYEAHQMQWVTGRMPLAQLLQEPQGQRSLPQAFQHAIAELAARATPVTSAPADEIAAKVPGTLNPPPGEKVGAGGTASSPAPALTTPNTTAATAPQSVPDDLRPLVQQQLDAAGTQRLAWHGEVWPRQSMEMEIDWNSEREADGREEEGMRWSTTLSLTTPRLGHVDARLHLTASGVDISIATPYGASAADLRDEAPRLARALEAAGVPLQAFHVRHEDEHPAGER